MPDKLLGYFYLSLAMVTVGSTVIASKVIAFDLPPFTATALRFAIALPIFLALMRLTGTGLPKAGRRGWLLLLLQAGAGSVGYTTLLISGLSYTTAADAGVVIGTLPVVSAVIAVLVLGERPRAFLLTAIAFAAAGVLSITFPPGREGSHTTIGNLLVLGAVICEGLFILLNKRLRLDIPPLALSTIMTGFGMVVALPFALLEMPDIGALTAEALAAVAYYALIPTVGGFLLWYAGAARVSGAEASLFTALAPVSAVVLAAVLLGEAVTAAQVAGIACVLSAVLGLAFLQISKARPRI
ncbi:DMT family transporter [Mesorhizobium sp. 1B3]|uniref:DMT family transporter n=1 Tax=Mesorhizobium sp. 1B3 TaxID=3243599 RepID=UPI003D992E84